MSVGPEPGTGTPAERLRACTAEVLAADRERARRRHEHVRELTGRRVVVTGAVRRSATFLWDDGVTVADAIAIGRGLRPEATRVVVLRQTRPGVAEALTSATRTAVRLS